MESNPESKSINKPISPSWNRPWANEWCLQKDSFQASDQALQARFARSDEMNSAADGEDPEFSSDRVG